MCGICCVFGSVDHQLIADQNYVQQNSCLMNRGPDCHDRIVKGMPGGGALMMSGAVLHLRGELTSQPLQDPDGNFLLWNGEIFGGIEVPEDKNDTRVLLVLLRTCAEPGDLLRVLARMQGPFAFIYWQEMTQTLWFGRDVLGRRSLLWHIPETSDDLFILSSVQIKPMKFEEVPAVGIFSCQFHRLSSEGKFKLKLFPWQQRGDELAVGSHHMSEEELSKRSEENSDIFKRFSALCPLTIGDLKLISWLPNLNKEIPTEVHVQRNLLPQGASHSQYLSDLLDSDSTLEKLTTQLIDVLQKAVSTRIFNQPRGTSTVAHQMLETSEHTNSCIGREEMLPGSGAGWCSYRGGADNSDKTGEITSLERCTRACAIHESNCDNPVLSPEKEQQLDSAIISRLFVGAVSSCIQKQADNGARVAILFSGGLDSAVLAALADRCVPQSESIDLVNVAFEKQPKQNPTGKNNRKHPIPVVDSFMVPDRETGLTALSELNPDRHWNFVECNISLEELRKARSERVSELLYPLCTVLDDSIGCAVWFAARGQGEVKTGASVLGNPYTSNAKVILVGMGADEQLAGYSRHRSRFQEQGWQGLADEIEMEVQRISTRNLGRDDRIITDHGKESRFPFLDENVVSFLSSLPLHFKADLTLPRGLGEKLLLRLCAVKLGLDQTAVAPKRAIQFGSRIAKMENSKERASDVCQRLSTTTE